MGGLVVKHCEVLGWRQVRQERDLAAAGKSLRRRDSGIIVERDVLVRNELYQLLLVAQRIAVDRGELSQRLAVRLADILYRESTDFQARFAGAAYAAAS